MTPRFVARRLDHPDVVRLVEVVQDLYRRLYGEGDEAPIAPDELAPPRGELYVGYLGDEPVATVAWRHRGQVAGLPGPVAEIKRMSVLPGYQGRGWGRSALDFIEQRIAAHQVEVVVLQTGNQQHVAVSMYRSAGYRPLPDDADRSWDPYADDPLSLQMWKVLPTAHEERERSCAPGSGHSG